MRVRTLTIVSSIALAIGWKDARCETGSLVESHKFQPGAEIVFELKDVLGRYSIVFEDDGSTGYLYALDYSDSAQPIQEAMQIYNVKDIADKDSTSVLEMRWSKTGACAGLWINSCPHAVFDFRKNRGYCRSNFPPPRKWKKHEFLWDDKILRMF